MSNGDDSLEITTWNLHNFPATVQSPEHVAELIAAMDLDLIAVQEVADIDAFEDVVSALPGYEGVLSFHTYSNGTYQKVGYIYRSSMLEVGEMDLLFEDDWYPFPRPPFEVEFVVERPDGSQFELVLLNVHLKANIDEESESRRRDAIDQLHTYLDGLQAANPAVNLVLLGDMNDDMDDPAQDNVFTELLDDPTNYRFLTSGVSGYSYIPYERLIDHLVINGNLFDEYEGGQTRVIELDRQIDGYDYEDGVSDHLPVVSVFPFSSGM